MTIPAKTIREIGELTIASGAAGIAAVLNVQQHRLPALNGARRHVYTTEDCYPAAFGKLQAMASELLHEREALLGRIEALESLSPLKSGTPRPWTAQDQAQADEDFAMIGEFDRVTAGCAMGIGNVNDDDEESLQFADESEWIDG